MSASGYAGQGKPAKEEAEKTALHISEGKEAHNTAHARLGQIGVLSISCNLRYIHPPVHPNLSFTSLPMRIDGGKKRAGLTEVSMLLRT